MPGVVLALGEAIPASRPAMPGDIAEYVGFNGKPRPGLAERSFSPPREGRAMSTDDDNAGARSLLSQLWAPAHQEGEAEAPPGDPGPVAPGAGIGLGTAASWLDSLLGVSPFSEEGRIARVLALAEEFEQAGNKEIAIALREATTPKRGPGRPPKWTDAHRMSLAMAFAEELHADPTLRDVTAVIRRVTKRPEWREWKKRKDGGVGALRKQLDRRIASKGRTLEQEFDRLRGLFKPRQ
jgi:hypothetical protein